MQDIEINQKLKESGFTQIPNQFKALFHELVAAFEQNAEQREKLEVVNEELAWRIKDKEQKIEDSSKMEQEIVELRKQISEPQDGPNAKELEEKLQKQIKLKEGYLEDMRSMRLKNKREKDKLNEKIKELQEENTKLKSMPQSEENSVKQDRNETIISSRMTPAEIRRGSYAASNQKQMQKMQEQLKEKDTRVAELQLQQKATEQEMMNKIRILEDKLAKKSNILRLQPSHFRRKSDCLGQANFSAHARASFDENYVRTSGGDNSFKFYPRLEEHADGKENKSEQNTGRMHSGRYFEQKRPGNLMASITPRDWMISNQDTLGRVTQTTPDERLEQSSMIKFKAETFNQSFEGNERTLQVATPCRTQAGGYFRNGLLASNSLYYPSPMQHSTPGVVFSRGGYFSTDSERGRKGNTRFMNKKISNYIDALKHKNDHLKEKLSTSIEQRKKLKEQLTSCNIVIKNLAVRPKSSGLKRPPDGGNASFRRMTLPRENIIPH